MTVGFVMLAHAALNRAADVALMLADAGCPVAIHVDRRTVRQQYDALKEAVARVPAITVSRRHRCDWGTWSLVRAARDEAEQLLRNNAEIGHVMLISGACVPIKPIGELKRFLSRHPETDFIESVTVEDVPWTAGGLSEERFQFSFPFAWKRRRRLFDLCVESQRRIGWKRALPAGLRPHLGSQWWCLSRGTLEKILSDPRRRELDRFFRLTWIPDESYFQSLARMHGARIESRSLTLSKFDFQGKPHIFYDDHLGLLSDSPAYFARKIWPGARRIYATFLSESVAGGSASPESAGTFADRVFSEAVSQRTAGRPGLAMAGRFPREGFENGVTAGEYAVFYGFSDVLEDLPEWLERETGTCAHGRLFAPDRCHFAHGEDMWAGGLCDSAALRDYDPEAFLRNLVWNTRGKHQSFQLTAADNLKIGDVLARDRNATVFAVTGAGILPLMRTGVDIGKNRAEAARLQSAEASFVTRLCERRSLARRHVWNIADFLAHPTGALQEVLDVMTETDTRPMRRLPAFGDLAGLKETLQSLRNAGMNPYMAGNVATLPAAQDRDAHAGHANVVPFR